MSVLSNPSEVAREALRQLALRRVAPTPDNYRKLYHEIAGTRSEDEGASESFLRSLGLRLPRDSAERQRIGREFDQALAAGKLKAAEEALGRYLDGLKTVEPPAWNELIANLLRAWEARQPGWTTARKRESLDRVLNAADPATLHARLQGLLRGWNQGGAEEGAESPGGESRAEVTGGAALPAQPARPAGTSTQILRLVGNEHAATLLKLLQATLQDVVPAFLGDHPELADEATQIAQEVGATDDTARLDRIGARLRQLAHRLEMTAADDAEIRSGLLELLRLLLRNIDDLVLDDKWLAGQIEMLREIIDAPPNPRNIDDAGRRLKDLIYKQSQLKHNLVETQRHLRQMLAGFVDQLARFSESTGAYHDRIGSCAQRIAEANDISAIGPLLDEVMQETRSMQDEAQRSRDELIATREQARLAEERIAKLQEELDEASRQMRHDQLTGTLNRRGLEEVFEKEAARAQRRGSTLSIGLLDIDHFKKLNDTLGHHTGDAALVHLANVVRKHLRPQDVLARFGGEEFLILLPETETDDAYRALIRLQRELTREFFMADQQKIVITFSAGVTPLGAGESFDAAMKRADAAMYQAKQAGRNRVMQAPLKQAAV
ncbi:Diguanylate cyclase [Thauera humireducens]|uniref:GGDEF domain-containing protein n=1 Tax=Thauera humireducens TaxID=1134435 RepID=UPI002467A564|nr:GGDEF domain-containing protein [Thauera humireducens]CAH1747832.1 Diguanylate cyclase [Thauera humireducens]